MNHLANLAFRRRVVILATATILLVALEFYYQCTAYSLSVYTVPCLIDSSPGMAWLQISSYGDPGFLITEIQIRLAYDEPTPVMSPLGARYPIVVHSIIGARRVAVYGGPADEIGLDFKYHSNDTAPIEWNQRTSALVVNDWPGISITRLGTEAHLTQLAAIALSSSVKAVPRMAMLIAIWAVFVTYYKRSLINNSRDVCRSCGYDLRYNETGRCPECGAEFDSDDRR